MATASDRKCVVLGMGLVEVLGWFSNVLKFLGGCFGVVCFLKMAFGWLVGGGFWVVFAVVF